VPLRIVVADDNDAFLAAARDVLSAAPELEVAAAVSTGRLVLEACDDHRPDVAVIDVQMPGGGPALAGEISRRWPETRIMCLSARDDADTVLAMLAAGATAYVAKGALDEDLATCVRRCGEGMLFVIAGCAADVRQRLQELVGRWGQGA
jgi:DNA-binding NarL/FixJ family response regulator